MPRGLPHHAVHGFEDELQRTPRLASIWWLLDRLHRHPLIVPDFRGLEQSDSGNGLRHYLELLVLLRINEPAASRPTSDSGERLVALLDRCLLVPPIHLHANEERKLAEQVLRRAGLSPRETAAWADRLPFADPRLGGVRGSCIPVARELADRLLGQAAAWRGAGRAKDAELACRVVVRLLTDLVGEFPATGMVLLAADKLPPALRGLGEESAAQQAEALRAAWQESIRQAPVNLLPWTGDFVLARVEHDHVLRSMLASTVIAATWLGLAGICLVLLLVILFARPPRDAVPAWRWPRGAGVPAAAVACAPLMVCLAATILADIPFTWLLSAPSLPACLLVLTFIPAALGLATWLCVRPPPGAITHARVTMVVIMGFLVASTLFAGSLLLPLADQPGRPPAGIQWFRHMGVWIGAECGLFALIWVIGGSVRRRRAGLPRGVWARANLAVAARSLAAVSVALLVSLAVNHRLDAGHEQAFIRAMADPIADRLGPDWMTRHIDPARSLILAP